MINTVIQAVTKIVLEAARLAREGLTDEEIQERLANPSKVADDILERIEDRKERGEDLLGRKRT